MKKLWNFNDFINEELDVNKTQFLYKKLLRSLKVKLYYASTYELSITAFLPVIDNFTNAQGFIFKHTNENVILMTIYGFSVLSHEGMDKLEAIHTKLKDSGIVDHEMQKVVNIMNNLRYLYSELLSTEDNVVNNFVDMIKNTAMFVPFAHVINTLILNNRLNLEMFLGKYDGIKTHLGEDGFEILRTKILNKMNVIVGSGNKFQNVDYIKPLIVNDEFKSPMHKSEYAIIQDNLTEKLNNKNDNEI